MADGGFDWTGIGAITNAAKLPLSIYQMFKAAQLRRNRPTYNRPKEYEQNLNMSKNMALQGLPQDIYNQQAGMIDRNLGFGLRQSGSRRGGLTGLAAQVQNANDAYGNLNAQDAQARYRNQLGLQDTLLRGEGYSDKEFQINELDPYNQDMAAKNALEGAGIQNLYNTISGVSDSITGKQYLDFYQGLYGGQQGAPQNPFGNPIPMPSQQKQQGIAATMPYFDFTD